MWRFHGIKWNGNMNTNGQKIPALKEAIVYYYKVCLPSQHLRERIRKARTASSHVTIQTGYLRKRSLGLPAISLLKIHRVSTSLISNCYHSSTSYACYQFFFFIFFNPISFSILWPTCAHIHISDCVQTAYELPLLPNNTATDIFLQISGAVRSVDWIKCFTILFKQEVAAAPSYCHTVFLTLILQEAFIRNTIIILCINYIITIRVNDNNAIINYYYGRLQDLILHFKIPMGTRKNFL